MSDTESSAGTILHLIDTDGPGGAEAIFVALVEGLADRGWRSIPALSSEGWSSNTLEARGIEPEIVPSSGGWDAGHLGKLWSLIRREGIDLVQMHLLGPALYGSVAARLWGIPAVATFHGSWDLKNAGSLPGTKRRILQTCLDVAVFVSSPLRRQVVREGAPWSAPTAVIPNGIDVPRFRERSEDGVRAELGIADDHFLVGTVGNVRPAKSHRSFLELSARLRRLNDRYRFVIVGDTSVGAYRELRALRFKLGLEDRLVFTGYRDDVERILASLDVFALSSRSEGFSLTTVEAMASGVPVVATKCGGPEEIVDDGETGFLVDVGDMEQMARMIEKLRRSPALRTRLSYAAYRKVLREYSRERMIASYEALYCDLLSATTVGRCT